MIRAAVIVLLSLTLAASAQAPIGPGSIGFIGPSNLQGGASGGGGGAACAGSLDLSLGCNVELL